MRAAPTEGRAQGVSLYYAGGTKQVSPGTVLVAVSGRLVLGREVERLETVVKDLVEETPGRVVFDLTGWTTRIAPVSARSWRADADQEAAARCGWRA